MQKTNLNVSPYYDDFSEDSLYHRVLFRPAFSVQARELTQMQSILQNQIERIGSHFFKEGAVVIPGQTGFDVTYSFVKVQSTFVDTNTVTHTVENYRTDLVGKRLTGATSAVVAKVVNTQAAEGSNDLTLFVKYEKSGTAAGGTTNKQFANGESLKVDSAISYTASGTSYTLNANEQVATSAAAAATGTGSSASVQKGIFYIRGAFVQTSTQTIVLDAYSATPSYRIGFQVTESLVTPEEETALLDNATGSTNFAAKGAHRLKYTLTLTKKALGTADDADFIELMSVKLGLVQSQVRNTEYSVLEDTLARRTFDESGDYIVRGFDLDMREHYDDGLNDGVFNTAAGGDASKIAIGLSPGKAYVRGYEIGTQSQTFIGLNKARSTAFVQNNNTTFSAGNYLTVENVYGIPDISNDGTSSAAYKEIELRDRRMPFSYLSTAINNNSGTSFVTYNSDRFINSGIFQVQDELVQATSSGINANGTLTLAGRGYLGSAASSSHPKGTKVQAKPFDLFTRGSTGDRATATTTGAAGRAKTVGVARTRAFEVGTAGTEIAVAGTSGWSSHPINSTFHHYIFDVRMLCKVTLGTAAKLTATNFVTNGSRVKGSKSGATGIVYIAPQDKKFTDDTCDYHSGAGSPANTEIAMDSTAGLEVGMGVDVTSGTNITDGTYITSIKNATTVVVNQATAASGAVTNGTLRFGNALNAGDGQKLDKGTTFHLIQTTGTFQADDVLTSSNSADFATSGALGAAPTYYTMADAHSLYGVNSQSRTYYSDIKPMDVKKLTGTASTVQSNAHAAAGYAETAFVLGTNTQFTSDLKVGDLIEMEDSGGVTRRHEVQLITSDTRLQTIETFPTGCTSSVVSRVRSKVEEQEELVMISKLPKQAVKTLKAAELNNNVDTTITVRRQRTFQLEGGAATFSIPEGESFIGFTNDNYVMSVVVEASSTPIYPAGTVLHLSETSSDKAYVQVSDGGSSFAITLSGGKDSTVKLTYTTKLSTVTEKSKTLTPSTQLAISVASGGIYGTNYQDQDISLNKADIFKVRAIYKSASSSVAAVAPVITYSSSGGNIQSQDIFQAGDKITGSNGAIARIIDGALGASTASAQQASVVYLTTKAFTTGTTITSQEKTSNSGTLTISAVTAGDENILSDYQVDTGMRDTYYDIGSISRKAGVAPPTGRLLIVYDFFTHGAGNYFSVDSYPVGTTATSITYDEIPMYSAQRVDPDVISPTGEYDLRDSVDFRPRVGDYDGTNTVSATRSITPISFVKRDFSLGSASVVDIPKTDTAFECSFNYYLPQNGALWLDSEGEFKTVLGAAAENPENPKPLDDAMQIAEFRLPPYTFSPQDIGIRRLKNRRFTMRDIGKINERVENLEYYSQLNMLEKDTESFQIQDADGLDRFKNGFIVDNFTGHSVGDGMHPDYKNSMDMANGVLRPEFKHRMIELEEKFTTDAERTSVGYQKTGALITLPYTEVEMVNQPYASRIENVNPFNVIAWVGSIALDPASDIWKDTNRLPNLVINREGNYDSFIARNGGSAVNTVWNEWETFWSGEKSNSVQWRDRSWATARKQLPFRRVMERTVTTTTSKQSRQGVRTEIVPRIDYESKGDKVVSTEILPYCRARDVNFTCKVFKPLTRLFAFFDNVDVTQYCKPVVPYTNYYSTLSSNVSAGDTVVTVASISLFNSSSGSITIDNEVIPYTGTSGTTQFTGCTIGADHTAGVFVYKTPVAGDPLITGATGKCAGVYSIPDPNTSGNPAFKVGERIFRLTSDQANGVLSGDTETAGEATYFAKGLLDNIQETIIATRNADVHKVTVNESKTVNSTRVSDKQIGWWDPVAQSFLIDVKGGAFVTSVNCYFQSKSATVPVQCQMRTMKNGYPSTVILPFGTASVEPEDVTISEDATSPTKFTFPSPIYLQQDIEYCFVIMANTQDYMIWLSHMGDVEVGGTRTISDQPYAGVMFKSQNASTWSAAQMEDLKFSINRASFSLTDGVCTLQNTEIPTTSLGQSPIMTVKGTKKIKVRHLNHGMYRTGNYVKIDGMVDASVATSGSAYDLSKANGTYTISEMGIDHYILDLSTLSGSNAVDGDFSESKVTGGSGVTATENYMMDTTKLTLQLMEIGGTDVITKIRTTSGSSPSGGSPSSGGAGVLGNTSQASFNLTAGSAAVEISPNENTDFTDPTMVCSGVNEQNTTLAGTKSFHALCTMTTPVENLSPVIDTQRMGLICIQNRLNNIKANTDYYSTGVLGADTVFSDGYAPSTYAEGDNNVAVYITRKVSLANASTSLKVMFDAIVFNSAAIDVYYKVLSSDDTTPFGDITWTEMTIDKSVSESMSYTDFRERTYEVSGLEGFIAFSVKLVMRGTKSTEPPFIKDFRAIALAL